MSAEAAYGAALTLMVSVAVASPKKDRLSSMLCSWLLVASWLLYNAPWHGWGIRLALHKAVSHSEAWAMGDTLVAMMLLTIYKLYNRSWVLLIFAMLAAQIACYAVFDHFGLKSWRPIEGVLDLLFAGMIAVVATVGGRGIGDLLVYRGIGPRCVRDVRGQDF